MTQSSTEPDSSLRRLDLADPQLHALEYLLNDIGKHGLQLHSLDDGQWQWQWNGQSGLADGLGSAIMDALTWYFGLLPDPPPATTA